MSQKINLFNPALLPQKNYLSARAMAQALGLLLAGGLLLAYYGKVQVDTLARQAAAGKSALGVREARKATVTASFAPRPKDKELDGEIAQAEAERKSLLQVQTILQRGEFGSTRGYSPYFRAFARRRIDGLWLTDVAIVGAGNAIGLQGRVLAPGLLPDYIAALSGETVLKGKSFARLELTPARKRATPAGEDAAATPPATPAAPPAYLEFSLQATAAEVKK
ncbi:MSHA biogenesis protein MshA [Janthinobacterium sp.]|uniref:MSHA biogenesis protein MshA n=1 Tax=Janthinobacterium sp. TaxID=1871054 RepID=UPI00293D4B13|nr:MSHA biogenesis protein MshA [Janthinobacterium sp.]